MSNVYDIFTRRRIQTGQDTAANDAVTEEKGRFIGNMGKKNAEAFRLTVSMLENLEERINELMTEYDELANRHFGNVTFTLKMLNALDKFDGEKEDLMVSEDGNVWIVKEDPLMYEPLDSELD